MEEKNLNETVEERDETAVNDANDAITEQNESENTVETEDATAKLTQELDQLKDTHLRLMAEYDNYRRRTLKEKADLIKNGGEQALTALLPIIDDFERALDNMNTPDDISNVIVEGVQLIYGKFIAYLNQNGVKVIETEAKEFDSELFDAIATIPAPSKDLKGKIVDCVQKGYTLNEKVIRHAKVVVGE